ncbi:glycosyltransferase [Dyadobacter psychrotolerans]|uniref:Glycosyltransferase n=1 Tax=Dyadobacter psychrotolerans TaxID=2541721 RepID=A0A4R5DP14_9BACT|nr:glycosyltransferase [Dyadobacter psychrotolerans]TDE15307.1 glycosyltransferase [Dyadobacter psychrotolerans]
MSFSENPVQVSILLAARNEENNIERCLLSLFELDFPKTQLEILIGDDDSSDKTAEIIHNFILDKPLYRYFKIKDHTVGLKGKANVLAQLSHQAKGKYFFYCDADIAVPSTWIYSMLEHFQDNTGVVVGLTRMKRSHLFADFLSLEWLFTLSILRFFSIFKIALTGLGNNMAVTREAYFKVGGYEKIGFSIVEDYALFMAIVKAKYKFVQTYSDKVLAYSEPLNSFSELKTQRRRWMYGIMESPLILRICVIMSALYVPIIALIAIWDPHRSWNMAISHYALITAVVLFAVVFLKQKDLWKTVFFFWFYLMSVCVWMLIIYLSPGETTWKGRTY